MLSGDQKAATEAHTPGPPNIYNYCCQWRRYCNTFLLVIYQTGAEHAPLHKVSWGSQLVLSSTLLDCIIFLCSVQGTKATHRWGQTS